MRASPLTTRPNYSSNEESAAWAAPQSRKDALAPAKAGAKEDSQLPTPQGKNKDEDEDVLPHRFLLPPIIPRWLWPISPSSPSS